MFKIGDKIRRKKQYQDYWVPMPKFAHDKILTVHDFPSQHVLRVEESLDNTWDVDKFELAEVKKVKIRDMLNA